MKASMTTIKTDFLPPYVLTPEAQYIVKTSTIYPHMEDKVLSDKDFAWDNNGVKTMLYLTIDSVKQALDKIEIGDEAVLNHLKKASAFLVDVDFTHTPILPKIQHTLASRFTHSFISLYRQHYPSLMAISPVNE